MASNADEFNPLYVYMNTEKGQCIVLFAGITLATFNSLEQAIKGDLLIEFCGIKVSSDVSNIGKVV
jgi:hypothetical protein